jgi:histidine triad (HIT) family protein
MYNHAPSDYTCLFCCLIQNIDCAHSDLQPTDIIHQNEVVTAFMAVRRFPNNQGHVLVIPNQHFENIYDLPVELTLPIHKLARTVALAMKAIYKCDGILIRQHNEPAGGQHAWHYHLHIIPRYENDDFYCSQKQPFPSGERTEYAQMLRNWIENNERLHLEYGRF